MQTCLVYSQFITHLTLALAQEKAKLRTYKLLKSNYEVEHYRKIHMSYAQRSAYAKFRCCVAPIKLETGRYKWL